MDYSLTEQRATGDPGNQHGDCATPIVPGYLAARKTERRILLVCSMVGLIGVAILLAVVAGSIPDVAKSAYPTG